MKNKLIIIKYFWIKVREKIEQNSSDKSTDG